MKRFTQLALAGVIILAVVSVAAAQQVPQPVTRVGDWVEIGNEVFMHLIATTDIRYRTTHNFDCEDKVRDRAVSRDNLSTQRSMSRKATSCVRRAALAWTCGIRRA